MRVFIAVLGAIALAAPAARAQAYIPYRQTIASGSGSYARVDLNLAFRQPAANSGRPSISMGIQTSVLVPDGGETSVASYSTLREGRNEFGTPILGKTPYLNRGFKGTGSGRSISNTRASVRVRIIRMADEEERQTGVRP